MAKNNKKSKSIDNSVLTNGLADFTVSMLRTAQLGKQDTLLTANNAALVSFNRNILTYAYANNGIVQRLCSTPVRDALRGGLEIKGSFSPQELDLFYKKINELKVVQQIEKAMTWSRLFGGGALMINTTGKCNEPLKYEDVYKKPIEFVSCDRWELSSIQNIKGSKIQDVETEKKDTLYNYYGYNISESRLIRFAGEEAPSLIRPQLQGWGISVIDRALKSINQYIKHNNLLFELLDEAKIDVYKLEGYKDSLINGRESSIKQAVQLTNEMKNYHNALILDVLDEYQQKQLSFAGFSDILGEIRKMLSADLNIPMAKLFGLSASGFNSGEDDLENYNAMVESELRTPYHSNINEAYKWVSYNLFGDCPDDFDTEYQPLRLMSEEQQEAIKTSKFNRILSAFQAGLITDEEATEAINKDSLLNIEG